MLDECFQDDCRSEGIWVPVFVLRKNKNGTALRASLPDVRLCQAHRDESSLETFLSDEGWSKMQRHLRESGKGLFAKEQTVLDWRPAEGVRDDGSEDLPF